MKQMKKRIESAFEGLARWLYRHYRISLVMLAVAFGGLLLQVPDLQFDMSSESLLHANDPYRLQYDRFREEFGQDRNIVLGITGPDIFSYDFLIKLKSLHQAIESGVPYVKRVNSLITARNISGKNDLLDVGELMAGWPETPVDMNALRQRVMSDPYYRNYLISEDGTMTAISIETDAVIVDKTATENDILAEFSDPSPGSGPDEQASEKDGEQFHYISSAEIREIVDAVSRTLPLYETDNFSIAFSGSPVVVDAFNRAVAKDMVRCSLFAILTIGLFLGLLFKRLFGVILPLMVVVASVFSALGVMAFFNVDVKIMTAILPVFILCVGVADAVHVLTIFFRHYHAPDKGGDAPSKEDAIARALGHSGLAILLTSLTTAAGLLSFSFAEVSAIGEMGIFSAAGVIIALFYTLLMLPPMLALIPLKPTPPRRVRRQPSLMDRVLTGFAHFSVNHAGKITTTAIVLLCLSLFFLTRLQYRDHMLNYFPSHMTVKQDIMQIEEKLKGVITYEAVVDTGAENGLHNPAILKKIDQAALLLKQRLKQIDPAFDIHKIITINDIVKAINKALNNDDPGQYRIPDDPKLVAQELLLFENSGADDLEPIVDTRLSKTRMSIKVPWLDSMGLYQMSGAISRELDAIFDGYAQVNLTGLSVILARTLPATLNSMYESYVLAAIVISLLMVLLVGDLKIGLLSMFPNLLPILAVIGSMAALSMPLDMTTLMIGSIAIGLVVDDTMHFMYNFRKFLDQTGDVRESVRLTLTGTGRALMITSMVLAGGFFTLLAATLPHLNRFGLVLGITIIIALLCDFLLAPALMTLVMNRAKKPHEHQPISIIPGGRKTKACDNPTAYIQTATDITENQLKRKV
ncbi:MAG: MMPL family transporter [Thermodesulfobacteriota bacterium]|nr:MMPL family transporter [Thermodesulfobacteriota bacterium]